MTPSDYTPGPPITTAEELRQVLRHDDAVYYRDALVECSYFLPFISPLWPRDDLGDGRFRRAWLKCGQTAAEMRTNAEGGRP